MARQPVDHSIDHLDHVLDPGDATRTGHLVGEHSRQRGGYDTALWQGMEPTPKKPCGLPKNLCAAPFHNNNDDRK